MTCAVNVKKPDTFGFENNGDRMGPNEPHGRPVVEEGIICWTIK